MKNQLNIKPKKKCYKINMLTVYNNYFIFVCYRLIPTYLDDDRDDGSALFWILDVIEYFMYFTTIYLLKRVITLLDLF